MAETSPCPFSQKIFAKYQLGQKMVAKKSIGEKIWQKHNIASFPVESSMTPTGDKFKIVRRLGHFGPKLIFAAPKVKPPQQTSAAKRKVIQNYYQKKITRRL